MFCRNCGKELIGTPEICMNCGARPLAGNSFCLACGATTNSLAEICIKCGAGLGAKIAPVEKKRGKSKTASVLLAVFLTYWTWLYTYRRDAWKFWVGLGISLVTGVLVAIHEEWGWVISLGIWIWAIVDVAVKSGEWYRSY